MKTGNKAHDSYLGRRLQDITQQQEDIMQRQDHLERKMEDLTKEGSTRVLDRMHEIEMVSRKQCNDLLRILNDKGDRIEKHYKNCQLLVEEAEAKCGNMEFQLHRRGDRERQQTTEVHNELRAAITTIDQQASTAVTGLDNKLQRATEQISSLEAMFSEVQGMCERAEAAAAQTQSAAAAWKRKQAAPDWMTGEELGEAAVTRAGSLQPGSREIPECIEMAQEAASRSTSRQSQRSTSRGSHPTAMSSRGRAQTRGAAGQPQAAD